MRSVFMRLQFLILVAICLIFSSDPVMAQWTWPPSFLTEKKVSSKKVIPKEEVRQKRPIKKISQDFVVIANLPSVENETKSEEIEIIWKENPASELALDTEQHDKALKPKIIDYSNPYPPLEMAKQPKEQGGYDEKPKNIEHSSSIVDRSSPNLIDEVGKRTDKNLSSSVSVLTAKDLYLPPQTLIQSQFLGVNESVKKNNSINTVLINTPIEPPTSKEESWTEMEVSKDLPPRIQVLGEDLISVVYRQLPEQKKKRAAMPFDEFRVRVYDAVVVHPDVQIMDSKLLQAQAGKSEALAGLLPVVQGTSETGKRTIGRDSYLGTPEYNKDGGSYGITLRQVLFDFGASYFGFEAARYRERAAKELLNSKKSEQAFKTVSAFIDLEKSRAQMSLAQENISSRLAIVKLVRERFTLGGGSKPDIIRAEARYADALANVSISLTRLKNAEAAYQEAFSFSSKPLAIVNGPNHEIPLEGLNKTATELASSYPGILQLKNLSAAANDDAKAALAKLLPNFNFSYTNTVNGVNAPLDPSRSTTAIVQMSVNLFSGGAELAKKNQAKFKAAQAEQELQLGMRQFEKNIIETREEVRNSDELINARKVAAISAINSMRAVREQFAFNKGTLLDLMTAQESLYNAGKEFVDAEANRQIIRYRFLHLTTGLDKIFDLSDAAPIVAQ